MNRIELRLAIRQRADMVGSQFVQDDELDLMIDSSVAALHDLLCKQYGDSYWAKSTWIQTFPGTDPTVTWPKSELDPTEAPGPDQGMSASFALPADFVRLVRVQFFNGTVSRNLSRVGDSSGASVENEENWRLTTNGERIAYPMHPIDTTGETMDYTPRDWLQHGVRYRLRRGPFRQLSANGQYLGQPVYRWIYHTGTAIEFLPVPARGYAVNIEYVPKAQLLPDHPFPDYLIFDCAALCVEKQRSDSSTLRALQGRVREQIINDSRTVDAANPKTVVMFGAYHAQAGRSRGMAPWLR